MEAGAVTAGVRLVGACGTTRSTVMESDPMIWIAAVSPSTVNVVSPNGTDRVKHHFKMPVIVGVDVAPLGRKRARAASWP